MIFELRGTKQAYSTSLYIFIHLNKMGLNLFLLTLVLTQHKIVIILNIFLLYHLRGSLFILRLVIDLRDDRFLLFK